MCTARRLSSTWCHGSPRRSRPSRPVPTSSRSRAATPAPGLPQVDNSPSVFRPYQRTHRVIRSRRSRPPSGRPCCSALPAPPTDPRRWSARTRQAASPHSTHTPCFVRQRGSTTRPAPIHPVESAAHTHRPGLHRPCPEPRTCASYRDSATATPNARRRGELSSRSTGAATSQTVARSPHPLPPGGAAISASVC